MGQRGVWPEVRAVRAAVGSVCLALAAAGCTVGEPEPTSGPPTSSAPSPTPTPTPTPTPVVPPERPAAMDGDDETAALAAAEYFLALHEYAYATGDLTEWDRVSGQTCEYCGSVREAVSSVYSTGGRIEGGATTFSEFELAGLDQQLAVYGVKTRFVSSGGTQYDASGEAVFAYTPETGHLLIEVAPSVTGWMIFGVDTSGEAGS